MIGIGGWRNRTEKAGPFWYYKEGKLVSDNTPGNTGSHGARIPFPVTIRDVEHPITKGLPKVWMHAGDELYARLRGPGKNMTILATAYSAPDNRGTGYDEPVLMVGGHEEGAGGGHVLGADDLDAAVEDGEDGTREGPHDPRAQHRRRYSRPSGSIPCSVSFLRRVLRLMPRICAARTWLPPVSRSTARSSGFSTRPIIRS